MPPEAGDLLAVGVSVRALAQSARRGGWPVYGIDGFADTDTRSATRRCTRVPLSGQGLDADEALRAALAIGPRAALVYGGGLEGCPYLLERLAHGRALYGNCPATTASVAQPLVFFALLDRLGIPHPAVRFDPADEHSGWLLKHAGACGGGHVSLWQGDALPRGTYLQRKCAGVPMSVLFLADGMCSRVVGFSRLLVGGNGVAAPFAYSGAVGHAPIAPAQRKAVEGFVAALVTSLGLRGLNGLDFIVGDAGPLVLEMNPRPTATLELYDVDYREGLVSAHVNACRGRLSDELGITRPVNRGHALVYARRTWRIPRGTKWPPWTSDRPVVGSMVTAGDPVCTVHAEATGEEPVEPLLRERRQAVFDSLQVCLHPDSKRCE